MNVSTIQSSSAIGAISSVQPSSVESIPDVAQIGASSTSISKPGELMSKLQQLQQQDPAKLKEVAGELSQSLKTAAQSATGADAQKLNKLADGLANVASTGDLSSLQPQRAAGAGGSGGAHHGHHHHHGGGGSPPQPSSDVQSALTSAINTVTQALGTSTAASTESASLTSATSAK
jgi:hypothetical protein